MDTPDGRLLNPGHGERIHLGLGAKVGLGTKAGLEDQSGPREPKRASGANAAHALRARRRSHSAHLVDSD